MLNIPQKIKDLFKADNRLKNIRVSFPNREHSDICNDQIIKESLKFDESISSREEVKLGLCESSTLSFECVGVGNIKGMEIEAYIEIDATDITDDVAPTNTHEPVIICATPKGETEEKIFVIVDFPELQVNEIYRSHDNVDVSWKGRSSNNQIIATTYSSSHCIKLSHYRNITGVDPRGTSADVYDGYNGGGYERTYLYSVTTGKFYPAQILDFEWTDDVIPFDAKLNTGIESEAFLNAINHVYLDSESKEYMYPIEVRRSSDVPFPFYRVPLGRFIVDECKRDAKMLKRKVNGYSDFSTLSFGAATDYVMGLTTFNNDFIRLNIINYLIASNKIKFRDDDFTFTPVSGFWLDTVNYSVIRYQVGKFNNNPVYVELEVTGIVGYTHESFRFPSGDVVGRLNHYVTKSGLAAEIAECVSHMIYNATGNEYEKQKKEAQTVLNNLCYFCPQFIWVRRNYGYNNYSGINIVDDNFRVHDGEYFIMPYQLEMPKDVKITMYMDVSGTEAVIYTHTIEDIIGVDNVDISLVNTGHNTMIDFNPVETFSGYTYYPAYSELKAWDLLSNYTELLGAFGKIDRYGYFKTVIFGEVIINGMYPTDDLYPADDLYPIDPYPVVNTGNADIETIVDDDMISNWYEEYYIKYGGITCDYYCSELLDEDNRPKLATYSEVWDDANESLLYVLKDNAIIDNNSYTRAEIAAVIKPLVDALKVFRFCPSDLQAVGLPYVEAGDWLYTSMQGNHTLNLCLSRSMSGIQALRDKVKSN